MPKAAFDALMQQISTLQATVDQLNAIIEEKDQIILNQNRARFGQSSEKRTYILADGQLSMFEQAGDGIIEKAPEEVSCTPKMQERFNLKRCRQNRRISGPQKQPRAPFTVSADTDPPD